MRCCMASGGLIVYLYIYHIYIYVYVCSVSLHTCGLVGTCAILGSLYKALQTLSGLLIWSGTQTPKSRNTDLGWFMLALILPFDLGSEDGQIQTFWILPCWVESCHGLINEV